MKVRLPKNAGSWYAGSSQALKRQIEEECFLHPLGPGKIPHLNVEGRRSIVGLLCPHAGYMYSGPVAAHSYYALAEDGKPKTIVILGPNHHGLGSGVSIMVEGVWRTPFADVQINSQIAKDIQAESKYIDIDEQAHLYEHSIELQLPFLQYILGEDFDFIPISMMLQDFEVSIDVGKAIGKVLKNRRVDSIIIASSDLTHYEPQKIAEKKDLMVIESIKKLDEKELYSNVEGYNISMCGVGPTIAMLTASKILGAKKAKLLKYATSGDVIGDRSSVVGYCAMSVVKED